MPDTFRLVFVPAGITPSATAFDLNGVAYDDLADVLDAAFSGAGPQRHPFIAHKHMMFEPRNISVLHKKVLADREQAAAQSGVAVVS